MFVSHRENTAYTAGESCVDVKAGWHAEQYQGVDNTIV